MVITFGNLLIWLLIAALIGFVGELLARRRTPFGIVGAMISAFSPLCWWWESCTGTLLVSRT